VAVTQRWLALLTLAATLITAACGSQTGTPTSGVAVNTSPTDGSPTAAATAAVPFEAFLANVSAATYQDYAGRPGVQVRDSSEFQQMRAYILAKYKATRVTSSLADAGGAVFDCVQQSSASSASASSPAGGCPPGTIPTRRVTLTDLVRFPTLDGFLSKSPDGGGQLPPIPSSPSS
jgi:hypothetical protein